MANIRKQAILSSIVIYIGFFVGAINTYFFTKVGSFTPEQFGLTRIFYDIGQNIFVFGSLGIIPVVYKFYPYYKAHLPDEKNDLLTRALTISFIGFLLVLIGGYVAEPLIIRKFSERSPLVVKYYYLIFPFGFGMLLFSVLEAFCWSLHKTIFTNFLKETGMRLLVLLLIILYYTHAVSFDTFIKLFTFIYFAIFIALLIYLVWRGKFHLTFKRSRVTQKFKGKMLSMQAIMFSGIGIRAIAQTIDTILISSLRGLSMTGVFSLAQYAANLIVVPQRSVNAISTGVLAQAWRDKDYSEINRIYHRSSINLLIIALFIFGNIALNISEAFRVVDIQQDFAAGIYVVLVLGIARIIDAGTGVNDIIIGTSTFWRFDFLSGVFLLAIRIPLTYFLIKQYGMMGAAFAEVFSYGVYNFLRFEFIRRKFNMQPFTRKTLIALLLGAAAFCISYFLLGGDGWNGMILRSIVFSIVLVGGVFYFNVTPDARQLYDRFIGRSRR